MQIKEDRKGNILRRMLQIIVSLTNIQVLPLTRRKIKRNSMLYLREYI